MLIVDLKDNTAFVYHYRPFDKADWGTFIAYKVSTVVDVAEPYINITDIYSFDGSYLEREFQVLDESEFKVVEVFDETVSKQLIERYKSLGTMGFSDDDDDDDDKVEIFKSKEIRELLTGDYPEYFI